MIIGIPAQDKPELTNQLVDNLLRVSSDELQIVVIDNGSEKPFIRSDITVLRNQTNTGYYAPLMQLYNLYPREELIGLMHNDMLIYELDWNVRLSLEFDFDPLLMLAGFCGSNEVDQLGGRGGGTIMNFRGAPGYQQQAGMRNPGLSPAACLDSLFMMFRRSAIPQLHEDWENLPLAHFYDRIWPLRLVERGYHVATMGIEIDHMGGQTTVGNPRYYADCARWFEERNLPAENPETEMYLIAERRYLDEYRTQKAFIPCLIGADYGYRKV